MTVLDMKFEELCAYGNRGLLDRVVRSLGMEVDEDYLGALHALETYADAAAQFAGHNEPGRLRLRAILERSPVNIKTLEKDVVGIASRAATAEQRILSDAGLAPAAGETRHGPLISLDTGLPPPPASDGGPNSRGEVPLSPDYDRGAALSDPSTNENLYQGARDLSRRYDGPRGRQTFDQDLRSYIEAGIDMIATLEYQTRSQEVTVRTLESERKQLTRERFERTRRAEARALDRALGRRRNG